METSNQSQLKFSLICATLGRRAELTCFLRSISKINRNDFEVLVIDQNADGFLDATLNPFKSQFNLQHLKSKKGLSCARNIGLKKAKGQIVAFPDDDCWYPKSLLNEVESRLNQDPSFAGITGSCIDENHAPSVNRWSETPGLLTQRNLWNKAVSISIFLKKEWIEQTQGFDENLGAGADSPYQSGEETDLLLRLLKKDAKIYYDPEIKVGHPNVQMKWNKKTIQRGKTYGRGLGYLLKKHHFSFLQVLPMLIRPLGGFVLSLFTIRFGKAFFHWNVFQGRIKGWLS